MYYILCIYASETFRSRLIGWLNFISIIGILETTNRLIGYLVKVDSTNIYIKNNFFVKKKARPRKYKFLNDQKLWYQIKDKKILLLSLYGH